MYLYVSCSVICLSLSRPHLFSDFVVVDCRRNLAEREMVRESAFLWYAMGAVLGHTATGTRRDN